MMDIKGIGIDIISIKRMKEMVAKYGDRFLNRIFTEKEIDNFQNNKNSIENFAGRFAAKEAVIKATKKHLSAKDIEILSRKDGEPFVAGRENILVSISHEREYAIAMAIIREEGNESCIG